MFRWVLKCAVSYQREWLYQIPHRVRDVVRLRNSKDIPYILIEGKKVELPIDTFVGNIRAPDVNSYLKFYDCEFNTFYNSTPVMRVISQSFFLQIQEDMFFVLNNDPIVKVPQSSVYDQTEAHGALQSIVCSTINDLSSMPSIPRGSLISSIVKNVIDHSLALKYERVLYSSILGIVEKKIKRMEETIKEAENKLAAKAKRRVRWFTNFIIAEVAILHYFIYFNLSWDIMEPITVILGNIDLMVAYWFFILKGRNFSPEGWQKEIFNQKKYRHLLKEGIDVPRFEEYLAIRDYLSMRLGLLSRNPTKVLNTLSKPIKLLKTN